MPASAEAKETSFTPVDNWLMPTRLSWTAWGQQYVLAFVFALLLIMAFMNAKGLGEGMVLRKMSWYEIGALTRAGVWVASFFMLSVSALGVALQRLQALFNAVYTLVFTALAYFLAGHPFTRY